MSGFLGRHYRPTCSGWRLLITSSHMPRRHLLDRITTVLIFGIFAIFVARILYSPIIPSPTVVVYFEVGVLAVIALSGVAFALWVLVQWARGRATRR